MYKKLTIKKTSFVKTSQPQQKRKSSGGGGGPSDEDDEEKTPELRSRSQLRKAKKNEQNGPKSLIHHVHKLTKKTHFDTEQVNALLEIYKKLTTSMGGKMNRLQFRETLHSTFGLTNDLMLDRIFAVFDEGHSGNITAEQWVLGLSVLLKGTLDEQAAYCYEVFDISGDRSMGREELQNCLKGCLYPLDGDTEGDVEEGVREVIELAMKRLDFDKDGIVKFRDFHKAVHEDPIMLQAMGECLPPDKWMMTFLALIDNNPRAYTSFLSHPRDPAWRRAEDPFNLSKKPDDSASILAKAKASHYSRYSHHKHHPSMSALSTKRTSISPTSLSRSPSSTSVAATDNELNTKE